MAERKRRADAGSTVGTAGAKAMFAYAQTRGVDVEAILAELGIDPELLSEPEGRIPLNLYRRAWDLVSSRMHDAAFGLHLAEHAPIGTFEALDYALWASATYGDALDRLVRFHRIIGDDLGLHIVRAGAWARVHRLVVNDHRQRAECFVAIIVLRGRELLGRPLRLREVRFAHKRPADTRVHRHLFHCPIRFGASVTEVVFDVRQLDAPVRTARPGLAAVLDRHLRDLLSRLPQRGSFVHRVHQAIARTLHTGRPSLRATARALHSSSRTLQRKLQELGITHRQIVEDVRRDMAERLLATRRISISEVAFLLGFEDVSGFRRAYRRWTGMNPSRARAKG